ncbi:MAG: helix-turn-helix transcriptional regulator [Clostridia bacterium]|nr:helix-turn-helix transcriptional regulator [Clostridia bacterium]
MYRGAREAAGLSRDEAAFRLFLGTRTLAYYEAGKRTPGPDVVMKMAHVYNRPDLTVRYCRMSCPIGQAYSYEMLNNIDMSLPAVILKLISELREAMDAASVLLELIVNKRSKDDFTSEEWERFLDTVHEFIDVEHNVEILKLALETLTEDALIPKLVARHNQKCRERGYIKKEKAPALAVAR